MARSGKRTFCCGAGGAHMWMEERGGAINEERVREAAATGAETLAVACPFCTVMLDDGVRQTAADARRRRGDAARGGGAKQIGNVAELRLGTETAFEVLARAKALEAEGREIIHLQIGEPDFDTPAHVVEAGRQALRDGYTHYCPCARASRSCARRSLPTSRARARSRSDPAGCSSRPARSRSCSSACWPCDQGDEVIYPNPASRSTSR